MGSSSITILTPDKVDFQLKLIRRDKNRHFFLSKGTVNREVITILNIYVSNTEAPNFIFLKNVLLNLKTQINTNPLIKNNFNILLFLIDVSSEQKMKRETSELTDIIHQKDLLDIYRIFYLNNAEAFLK